MAGEMIWRKRKFLVANESERGTKTAGTIALISFDDDINLDGGTDERPGSGIWMGDSLAEIPGIDKGLWNPKVEMRAASAGAMETGLAALLQACGFKKATEVYAVHSVPGDNKCLSVDAFEDGGKKGLAGAQGDVTFTAETGKKMMCEFAFQGIYQAHSDAAISATAPTAGMPMRLRGGTFTIGGAAKRISKVSLKMNMSVEPMWNPAAASGIAYFNCMYSQPEITFDLESELVATYDIYSLWRAGTPAAIVLMVADGTSKATFTMPAVQHKQIKEGKRGNMLIYDCVGKCLQSTGNDSVSIAVAAV